MGLRDVSVRQEERLTGEQNVAKYVRTPGECQHDFVPVANMTSGAPAAAQHHLLLQAETVGCNDMVAGCLRDIRPVGRTSLPDTFDRVAVFGDHAPAAVAAGVAAAEAEAELPATEALRPDDDWGDTPYQAPAV